MELLSVIITPIVLCFSLPSCVPAILDFVAKHVVHIEGVGDVCDYSCFDFEAYGDERFGAMQGKSDAKNKPNDGKLEKSCINFHLAHPNWNASDGGKTLISRLQNYKTISVHNNTDLVASMLERSLLDRSISVPPGPGTSIRGDSFLSGDRKHDPGTLPSVLMSIMKQENIDYQNDFYWLTKFQQQRQQDPPVFESSLLMSQSLLNNSHILFNESINVPGGSSSSSSSKPASAEIAEL